MSPIPPSDQQTSPTRAELLAAIQTTNDRLATILAAVLNLQGQITDMSDALAAAGVEPGILGAILTAARTD